MAIPFSEIISVFVILFAILDPFMAAPPFMAMTRGMKEPERKGILREGILIAGAIMLVVLFAGNPILALFGISIESFKVAGGILMFIVGTQIVLGYEIVKSGSKKTKTGTIALLLGTPLLAGPAAITTMILMGQEHGFVAPVSGLALALIATYLVMSAGNTIVKFLGENTMGIFSRTMGLVLAAFGIEFIKAGVLAMLPGAVV
ncbi:MarC family integral membrane protein [uncultured archaeon]|nr:MarC family integral membrane protein [uncultured archaeon]